MSRIAKAFVAATAVALVAGLALATAASASPKLTFSQYPVVLKGAQSEQIKWSLPGARNVECTTATTEGTYTKSDAESSRIMVSAKYSGCTASILGVTKPATITMNSCTYEMVVVDLDSLVTLTKETYIDCNVAGDKIETHVFNDANHQEPLCTYTYGAQGPISKVETSVLWPGLLERKTETGIAVTKSSGTLTNCGATSQTASMSGTMQVEAFNEEGEVVGPSFDS